MNKKKKIYELIGLTRHTLNSHRESLIIKNEKKINGLTQN
jgi:hypothetical protein